MATGFNNFVSPFIRYKTEDIGIFTKAKSIENPHWVTIKEIEGRKQDFIVDVDHTPKTSIHLDRPFWNIRHLIFAYQYIQDTPGKLVLNIHANGELTAHQIQEIKEQFYANHFKFELTVNQVDYISRTKNGKFRYLVQNIKLNL